MSEINLIFPHQLFEKNPLIENGHPTLLIEEHLFFNQYSFHKQKIAFHRASMKFYESYLKDLKIKTRYIEAIDPLCDVRKLIQLLKKEKVSKIHMLDPTDNWLSQRISTSAKKAKIELKINDNPLFLNTLNELSTFFRNDKKKFFQTTFYIAQRKKWKILIGEDEKPIGDKWSFDADNRKKYPKTKVPPTIKFPITNKHYKEAKQYTDKYFKNNLGELSEGIQYPIDFKSAKKWLNEFLKNRFMEFGPYEDAIVENEHFLNHSILTPMLNVGLITPQFVINSAIKFSRKQEVPINSLEGFVRQIIGWREFIRGVYQVKGSQERTTNYWKFKRKIPASFYDGSTGIIPFDNTIHKVLKTGYCHHIERLMILGNFMLLCEFDPDEVYRWFMELFIDAYDWVMVPNVYGMSQFADGGLMSTKPYISSSNYILKMSNYKKGEWQATWDGLFWRFMDKQRAFFLKNPRMGMLIRTFDKMDNAKQEMHLKNADHFLKHLK